MKVAVTRKELLIIIFLPEGWVVYIWLWIATWLGSVVEVPLQKFKFETHVKPHTHSLDE